MGPNRKLDEEAESINETRPSPSEATIPETLPAEPPPRIRPRSEHSISRQRIDPDALKVLYRLKAAGYKGYLVGGSVRDLLLARVPKDFDIGTDAHPQALRKLFRNCRMIGRRFRLAHILFANGKVVEVATFRRRPDTPAEGEGGDGPLLQTSDNTFGTPREDALRRDFTINGLFYDISDFSVIDHVGGLEDLEAGLIRTIGDPDIRFQEDPVRMMRAVEFASRLGFAITPDAYEAILRHRKEIVKSAPPRVTEELAQSLRGGHALPTLLLMREVGLLDVLLPELADVLRVIDPDPDSTYTRGTGHLFWALLEVLDAERRRGRAFDDAVHFALLFVPIVRARVREASPGAEPDPGRLATIIEDVVSPLAFRMSLPRASTDRIKQALAMVGKLSHRPDGKLNSRRLAFREAFGTALDIFELSAMATGLGQDLVRDWRSLQTKIQRARETGEIPAPPAPPSRRRRRRGGRGRGKRAAP